MSLPTSRSGLIAALGLLSACGGARILGGGETQTVFAHPTSVQVMREHGRRTSGASSLWSVQLLEHPASYVPNESGTPLVVPALDRVFVGTSDGTLWGMNSGGTRVFAYRAQGPMDSEIAISADRKTLFVGSLDGTVHAVAAERGTSVWRARVADPIRSKILVADGTLFAVSDRDSVFALSAETGELLWQYKRDGYEGFTLTAHAGAVLRDGRLYCAFQDGTAVSLDARTGRVIWEFDSSQDLEGLGVDSRVIPAITTTPVIIGETVYVASIGGGIVELGARRGELVRKYEEWTGVTDMQHAILGGRDVLVFASAERGTGTFYVTDGEPLSLAWNKHLANERTPSAITISGQRVLVAESDGGVAIRRLADGAVLNHFDTGTGVGGRVAVARGLVVILSSAGHLYGLHI